MGGCVGEPEQGWEHDEVTGGGVVGPSLSAVLNVCGDGCEELFGGVDLLDVSRTIGAGSWPSTWVALNTTNVRAMNLGRPWSSTVASGCLSSSTVQGLVLTFHHTHPVPRSPLRTSGHLTLMPPFIQRRPKRSIELRTKERTLP